MRQVFISDRLSSAHSVSGVALFSRLQPPERGLATSADFRTPFPPVNSSKWRCAAALRGSGSLMMTDSTGMKMPAKVRLCLQSIYRSKPNALPRLRRHMLVCRERLAKVGRAKKLPNRCNLKCPSEVRNGYARSASMMRSKVSSNTEMASKLYA